jgi:hypothetical protein
MLRNFFTAIELMMALAFTFSCQKEDKVVKPSGNPEWVEYPTVSHLKVTQVETRGTSVKFVSTLDESGKTTGDMGKTVLTMLNKITLTVSSKDTAFKGADVESDDETVMTVSRTDDSTYVLHFAATGKVNVKITAGGLSLNPIPFSTTPAIQATGLKVCLETPRGDSMITLRALTPEQMKYDTGEQMATYAQLIVPYSGTNKKMLLRFVGLVPENASNRMIKHASFLSKDEEEQLYEQYPNIKWQRGGQIDNSMDIGEFVDRYVMVGIDGINNFNVNMTSGKMLIDLLNTDKETFSRFRFYQVIMGPPGSRYE